MLKKVVNNTPKLPTVNVADLMRNKGYCFKDDIGNPYQLTSMDGKFAFTSMDATCRFYGGVHKTMKDAILENSKQEIYEVENTEDLIKFLET